jgi:CBS-domain-containing membrane protein
MKVSDLQPHELFTAQADEGPDVAADRMNWHQVGALPVLDGQRLVDIMVFGGRGPVPSPPPV